MTFDWQNMEHGPKEDPEAPRKMKSSPSLLYVSGLIFMALSTIVLLRTLILGVAQTFSLTEPPALPSGLEFGPGPNDITPIPCHSHNDYWRRTPLYSALRTGCISVEADVWTFAGDLFVAHNRGAMKPNHNLTTMYIDPLAKILQEKNAGRDPSWPALGVYDQFPEQTLVLLVDIKADPARTWPLLLEQLRPLRDQGWLSHAMDGVFVPGPITVVGTGETPLNLVMEQNPWQDVFLDAPLGDMDSGPYSPINSYYASVSFKKTIGRFGSGGLSDSQLVKLRRQIRKAHELGLKARYWGMPSWPVVKRNALWHLLLDEGVDILNIDDLVAGKAEYEKREKKAAGELRPVILASARER